MSPPRLFTPQKIINLYKYYISFHGMGLKTYIFKNVFYLLLWNLCSSLKYTKC